MLCPQAGGTTTGDDKKCATALRPMQLPLTGTAHVDRIALCPFLALTVDLRKKVQALR